MSTIVSLETFAVGFAGFCCIFYGILGLSVICTSNCEKSTISDDAGSTIQLTPAIASFYCSLAIISGYIIFRLRDTVGQVAEGISTFGSTLRTKTVEGQEMRTFSVRFAVLLTLVFVVVVVFMRMVLLGPLNRCEPLDPEQAPFMFALRSTLKRMEFWVVGLGFALLASGLLFSIVETWYREGYAKRVEQGTADDEEYGWANAVYDKYGQKRDRAEKAWGWFTGSGGVTDKRTGEVWTEVRRGPTVPSQHDGNAAAHGSAHGPPQPDYHVEPGSKGTPSSSHGHTPSKDPHAAAQHASSTAHAGSHPRPTGIMTGHGGSQHSSQTTTHSSSTPSSHDSASRGSAQHSGSSHSSR